MGGYDHETLWDVCTVAALGMPFEQAQWRERPTLSGGEQKRLVLEALLRGPEEVLLLDEPDNYLDVPAKRWLEEQLIASPKTVLFVSHDRELLDRVATRIATLEPTAAGSTLWVHPGRFSTYHQARDDRNSRLEELRRRWDEEHAKLKALVVMYRQKAAYNSDMAPELPGGARPGCAGSRRPARPRRCRCEQNVRMRLPGGRTAKRAVICERLELTGLMQPFDLEVWFGERVAVLGSNGSGKSHFLRLLARGGSDPDVEHRPVGDVVPAPVDAHRRRPASGSRVRPGLVRPDPRAPRADGPDPAGDPAPRRRAPGRQAARGGGPGAGPLRPGAGQRSRPSTSLSGGQQARFQILLLELSGATLLLLDEPTDNLDLHSAEALEEGLDAFEGTVLAVTHDRWFARGFDRFLVFGADGAVYECDEPVWDEGRVRAPADGGSCRAQVWICESCRLPSGAPGQGTLAFSEQLAGSPARRRPSVVRDGRGYLCDRPTQWRVAPARPAAPTPLERPWPDPARPRRGSWPRSSLPPARSRRSSPLRPQQPRPRGP